MGYTYDRTVRTARNSDPRIYVNGQRIDRFLAPLAAKAADVSQQVKDEFVGLTDIANRLEREGGDDRLRAYWADRMKKSMKVLIAQSKESKELWKELVHADAVIRER